MNICMITPEFKEGGIGNYVYQLSKKLVEKGINISIITRGNNKPTNKIVIENMSVYKVPILPLNPFHISIHKIFVNRLLKKIDSGFDLLHLHSPILPNISSNLPIHVTAHTTYMNDTYYNEYDNIYSILDRFQSIFLKSMEIKTLKNADIISTVSSTVSQEIYNYGVRDKVIKVFGNGVNEKKYYPSHKVSNNYILYTGRLSERKGLYDLIDAMYYTNKKHPKVKLYISGKGQLLSNLKKMVNKLNIQRVVKFLGYVPSKTMPSLYRNAYVHIVPSYYEGLPTVLLEAMASGVPVIATSIGGSRDVISNNVDGFLVPPKNPLKLAESINMLLSDYALRDRLGKNARKKIIEKYTWEKICNNFISNYQKIRK